MGLNIQPLCQVSDLAFPLNTLKTIIRITSERCSWRRCCCFCFLKHSTHRSYNFNHLLWASGWWHGLCVIALCFVWRSCGECQVVGTMRGLIGPGLFVSCDRSGSLGTGCEFVAVGVAGHAGWAWGWFPTLTGCYGARLWCVRISLEMCSLYGLTLH